MALTVKPSCSIAAAFTVTTLDFTVQPTGNNGTISVASTAFMAVGMTVYIPGAGRFIIADIISSTAVVLSYPDWEANTHDGDVIPAGTRVVPSTGLRVAPFCGEFFSVEQTADCPEGTTGESVTIPAGAYSSTVSQEAANALALAAAQAGLECVEDETAPSTPVLTLDPDSESDNIPVEWTQESVPETNEIWRSQNGGAYALVATVAGADDDWTDNDGMASGDVWCYKVRGIIGETEGDFSNVGCAVKDMFFPGVGAVSFPTWMLAFGELYSDDGTLVTSLDLSGLLYVEGSFGLDNTVALASLNLNSLAMVGGPFSFASSHLTGPLNLPALETVDGDLTFTFAKMSSLNLAALQSVNGNIECDSCPNLVTVTMPNLLMQDARSYHFDNCKLNAASVEGILARAMASPGVTGLTTITLDSGTNAGLASLSAQGQFDYASLIVDGNSVSINP
jgi:hypothetical protein